MAQRIQVRRGAAEKWTAVNPILASGEIGYETDTGLWKFGDGTSFWNNLAYASTGGSSSQILSSGTRQTFVYDTSERGHRNATAGMLVTPVAFYYEGTYRKTYLVWFTDESGNIENRVMEYNHDTNQISGDYGTGAASGDDAHARGAIIVADDGHILVAHEALPHNSNMLFKRSNNAEDVSGGFTQADSVTGSFAYPTLIKEPGGDLYCVARNIRDDIAVLKSTDHGQTWTYLRDIVDFGSSNYWAYHIGVIQKKDDAYIHIIGWLRDDTYAAQYSYTHIYDIRTAVGDWDTWENVDGSWSKTVSSSGTLNLTDIDTHCVVKKEEVSGALLMATAASMAPTGRMFITIKQGQDTVAGWEWDEFYLSYYNSSTGLWVHNSLPMFSTHTDVEGSGGRTEEPYGVYAYNDSVVDVYVLKADTNKRDLQVWRSYDAGLNWVKIEDATRGLTRDLQLAGMTQNAYEAEKVLVVSGLLDASETYKDILINIRELTGTGIFNPVVNPDTNGNGGTITAAPVELETYIYDDFEDNVYSGRTQPGKWGFVNIDRFEWTLVAGAASVTGGVLTLTADAGVNMTLTTPETKAEGVWEFRVKASTNTVGKVVTLGFFGETVATSGDIDLANGYQVQINGGGGFRLQEVTASSRTNIIDTLWTPDTNWHTVKITRDSDGNFELFLDGTSLGTVQDTTWTACNGMQLSVSLGGDDWQVEWMKGY